MTKSSTWKIYLVSEISVEIEADSEDEAVKKAQRMFPDHEVQDVIDLNEDDM